MRKLDKTAADYMVIAISPALIMALVGSLCFFLIDVFYQGQWVGAVCWVMFWFVIGIVLVSRIAIEVSTEHAFMYGLGLAMATWMYMARMQPNALIGVVLLAVVWFCAHKLVFDCTLIDEDADSSGQGLLQKLPEAAPPQKTAGKPVQKRLKGSASPGRWVVYFSLGAVPLFGIGQMLLPHEAEAERRTGFLLLVLYLAAALGLLVTTSFLGLRRYLRQRFLKMPPVIAAGWLKFGVGVAAIVLIGAILLPRPGAGEAWSTLRLQIDAQLRRASQFANQGNPSGQGQGASGQQSGGQQGSAPQSGQGQTTQQSGGSATPSGGQTSGSPGTVAPLAGAAWHVYQFMRDALIVAALVVVGGWIARHRHALLGIIRSMIAAIREFYRRFVGLAYVRPAQKIEAPPARTKFSTFAEYKNPFFTTKDYVWPPETIVLYTYEAVQVWAREQGTPARPEETAREFCARLGEDHAELAAHLEALAHLYAYAAYGIRLPPNSNLEPLRELWRYMPVVTAVSVR